MIASGMKKNTPEPKSVVSVFTAVPSQGRRVVRVLPRRVAAPGGAASAPALLVVQLRAPADPRAERVVGRRDARRGGLGVVQVEGGALRADPRQRQEVVPRGRARGG